ncbi:receptor-like serine/threonine-protein kinase ALE2 isoform X2 [Andrographis paniculata]|uniref:receptor-like serine/threonine-protein kinase ALE2 isoform X2 n=1 Tax=Andrographis paniculata TaxID=175694 RepID=UPI0021E797B0|nr:receptor-like serine/threonine-protein kinase ALE2 isoform X2 [Andrographis paniculata]
MGVVVMVGVLNLVLGLCAFASTLVARGSAVTLVGEGNSGNAPITNVFSGVTPSPVPQPNGIRAAPPFAFDPTPPTTKGFPPSISPRPSASSPPNSIILSPPRNAPITVEAPVVPPSVDSPPPNEPPDEQANPPVLKPAPRAGNAPVSPIIPAPPPSGSIFPGTSSAPPPPNVPIHPSPPPGNSAVPIEPVPVEPPPAINPPRMIAPPPMSPVTAPTKRSSHRHPAPLHHSSIEAPKSIGKSDVAPPPRLFSKSGSGFDSPKRHHAKVYMISPPPIFYATPPTSGFLSAEPPTPSSGDRHYSPVPSDSEVSPRSPKTRRSPPLRALPPPPPHADCASLTCQEPLTYGPSESSCVCVLPIQVGIRVSVALYTFFPLVSELANEISAGVFLKQSQVRIIGANAAEDDPDKTIVHVDLLPLRRKFDDATANSTFERFWNKRVAINASFFGDYDVLYVRYPGLPPSPPLPPSAVNDIPSKIYPSRDNKTRTIQPLGVDISRTQRKHGLSRSTIVAVIVSCLVAVSLLCVALWFSIYRHRHRLFLRPDPTPPSTMRSLTKSSGVPISMVGSAPTSPSFSLNSSIAVCNGSARKFSSSDVERATDSFNEARVIGEGGFGRVYGGTLDDGTRVAIKILKRSDQQSGREFLSEVEMLSRLHHRNLVKLIGICVEDRARCLVYELIPNGSVESHLHGIDKERSPLDWSARIKIALGAARALAYLHEDSSPRVIHRDFKASNILLEDDFTPKVSDFGLARTAWTEENRHVSTRVMGTFGYLAPEYAMTGHLLIKSDVYSYGVVLLELLTGRKPVDMSQPAGRENLVAWARPLLTNREHLEAIVDPYLGRDLPFDSIAKVAAIASMCVQPEVSHRPFMGEVVQALRLVCDDDDDDGEDRDRRSSYDDFSKILDDNDDDEQSRSDRRLVEALLMSPSSFDGYDCRFDAESEVSLSELLSSSAPPLQPGGAAGGGSASGSFRRYCSSSGPIETSKAKKVWKTVRRVTRSGSVSEHGGAAAAAAVLRRLWPGSH